MEAWHTQVAGLSPQQALDLSTPFRPAALLNALEQQACRTAGVALGQLQLASCWPGASYGGKGGFLVQVTGLLLQGALFDGYSLQPVQQVGNGQTLCAPSFTTTSAANMPGQNLGGRACFQP